MSPSNPRRVRRGRTLPHPVQYTHLLHSLRPSRSLRSPSYRSILRTRSVRRALPRTLGVEHDFTWKYIQREQSRSGGSGTIHQDVHEAFAIWVWIWVQGLEACVLWDFCFVTACRVVCCVCGVDIGGGRVYKCGMEFVRRGKLRRICDTLDRFNVSSMGAILTRRCSYSQ